MNTRLVFAATLVLFTVSTFGTSAAIGQQPAASAARVEFDVASVKVSADDERVPRGVSFSPSGRFAWSRMTLKQLVQLAYGNVEFKDVAGGPAWLDTDRFDIAATSPDALRDLAPDGSPRGVFLRLRSLLEDRFQLTAHVEPRERPVFTLEAATRPLVTGRGLRHVAIDCEAIVRDMAAGRRPEVPDGQMPLCAMRVSPGQLTGHAISLQQVANALSAPAGRPIVDRTNLAGTYDIVLKWAPEFPPGTLINGAPPPPNDGPSLFTAIREQLGLKLEAARVDVPVLVIDQASRPTPD